MGGRLVRTLPFCKGFPEACLFFVENQSEAFFETSAHIRPWCVRLPRAVRCHADGWRLEMGGRLVERLPPCRVFPVACLCLVENESGGFPESLVGLFPCCVRFHPVISSRGDGCSFEMGGRLVERLPLCKGFPEGYVFLVENESWGFLESSLHLRHYHRR